MNKLIFNTNLSIKVNIKRLTNIRYISSSTGDKPRPNYTCYYQKDSDFTYDNLKSSKFQARLSAMSKEDIYKVDLSYLPSVDVCNQFLILGYKWRDDQIVNCDNGKRTGKLLETYRLSLVSRKYFVDDLAVLRTKTKKRMQNICSIVFASHARLRHDYLVLPRLSCLTHDYIELVEMMEFGLDKLHTLMDNNQFEHTQAVYIDRPNVDNYHIKRWSLSCNEIEKLAVKLTTEEFQKQRKRAL